MRFFAQTPSSALWNASSRNADPKFTHTAPPLAATAFSIASVMLRGMLVSARDDECVASTGLAVARIASQNVGSETCETSTIDAQAVHLLDHLGAEGRQAPDVARVARTSRRCRCC